jgi:predicted metal-binding protein
MQSRSRLTLVAADRACGVCWRWPHALSALFGDLTKAVGALALSTLTILVTAFAQEWIAGLAKFLQLRTSSW